MDGALRRPCSPGCRRGRRSAAHTSCRCRRRAASTSGRRHPRRSRRTSRGRLPVPSRARPRSARALARTALCPDRPPTASASRQAAAENEEEDERDDQPESATTVAHWQRHAAAAEAAAGPRRSPIRPAPPRPRHFMAAVFPPGRFLVAGGRGGRGRPQPIVAVNASHRSALGPELEMGSIPPSEKRITTRPAVT